MKANVSPVERNRTEWLFLEVVLLLQLGIPLLERLQLRDLTRWTGWRRLDRPPADDPVANVLPPLRQHERMNFQRGCYRLDLHTGLMTETNRRLLKLVRVLVQLARAGSWHV